MIRHLAGAPDWPQRTHFMRSKWTSLCLHFTLLRAYHAFTDDSWAAMPLHRWAFVVNLIISWDRTKRFGATKRLLHPRISHRFPSPVTWLLFGLFSVHRQSLDFCSDSNLFVRLSYESNTEDSEKTRWKLNHMVFVRIEIVLCANSDEIPVCLFVFSEWQCKKIKRTHVMRSTRGINADTPTCHLIEGEQNQSRAKWIQSEVTHKARTHHTSA